jgi:hypothetical protein
MLLFQLQQILEQDGGSSNSHTWWTPFFKWLGGADVSSLVGTIDTDNSRFFKVALAIGGWSHIWANIMKAFVMRHPKWPEMQLSLRALCTWLRNETHRMHICNSLRNIVPGIDDLFKSFNTSLAKWRYETVHDVMLDLLKLRAVMERYITRVMFPNPQDAKELDAVLAACSWRELWSWMAISFDNAIKRAEKARRWGIVCECCIEVYRRGQKPKCNRSSRRLHQARLFLLDFKSAIRLELRSLTLASCEGNLELMRWVSYSMRCLITDVTEKFQWLECVPWRFAELDDISQAIECVVQVTPISMP